MPIPFLDLKAQYLAIKPEIDAAIQQIVDSCAFASGPGVERFEKDFAAYCGTKHAVGTGNGTSALELILMAHGIGRGDEVITVANSFFASAEAISLAGATPVLVDCNEDDALIDVGAVERAITKKTKAIMPVHLYGQCADMDALSAIAKKHKLLIVEDACQAHGAMYNGKRAGSLGHAAAFSFYPGKNLGAFGEGGGIATDNDDVNATLRMLREHGMRQKYHHSLVGRNERMDGIQGAVLAVKLPHLDGWNAKRHSRAELYRKHLTGKPGITLFTEHPGRTQNYHLFVVRVQNRDEVQKKLAAKGIATGIHYPIPIHLQKAYADRKDWKKGSFPVSEKLADEILSLPMFAELTDGQVEEVCEGLVAAV